MSTTNTRAFLKKIQAFSEKYKNFAQNDSFSIPMAEINEVIVTLNKVFLLDPNAAIREYKKLVLKFPNEKILFLELAKLYILQGKRVYASTLLKKVLFAFMSVQDYMEILDFLSNILELKLRDPFFRLKTIEILIDHKDFDGAINSIIKLFNEYHPEDFLESFNRVLKPVIPYLLKRDDKLEFLLEHVESGSNRNLIKFFVKTGGILPFLVSYKDVTMMYLGRRVPPPFRNVNYTLLFKFKVSNLPKYNIVLVESTAFNKVLLPSFKKATIQSLKNTLVVVLIKKKKPRFRLPFFKSYSVNSQTNYGDLLLKSYYFYHYNRFPLKKYLHVIKKISVLTAKPIQLLTLFTQRIQTVKKYVDNQSNYYAKLSTCNMSWLHKHCYHAFMTVSLSTQLEFVAENVESQQQLLFNLHRRLIQSQLNSEIWLRKILSSLYNRLMYQQTSLLQKIPRVIDDKAYVDNPAINFVYGFLKPATLSKGILRVHNEYVTRTQHLVNRFILAANNVIPANTEQRIKQLVSRLVYNHVYLVGSKSKNIHGLVTGMVEIVVPDLSREWKKSLYSRDSRLHSLIKEKIAGNEHATSQIIQLLENNIFYIEQVGTRFLKLASIKSIMKKLPYVNPESHVQDNITFLQRLNCSINEAQRNKYYQNLRYALQLRTLQISMNGNVIGKLNLYKKLVCRYYQSLNSFKLKYNIRTPVMKLAGFRIENDLDIYVTKLSQFNIAFNIKQDLNRLYLVKEILETKINKARQCYSAILDCRQTIVQYRFQKTLELISRFIPVPGKDFPGVQTVILAEKTNNYNSLMYRLFQGTPLKTTTLYDMDYQQFHKEIVSCVNEKIQDINFPETLNEKKLYMLNSIFLSQRFLKEQMDTFRNLVGKITLNPGIVSEINRAIRSTSTRFNDKWFLSNSLNFIQNTWEDEKRWMRLVLSKNHAISRYKYNLLQSQVSFLSGYVRETVNMSEKLGKKLHDLDSIVRSRSLFPENDHSRLFVDYNFRIMLNNSMEKFG